MYILQAMARCHRFLHQPSRFCLVVLLVLGGGRMTSARDAKQADLSGEWVYVEDRTAGRELERMGPPMSAKFSMKAEEGAVLLVSGHGSGHRDVRVRLDGTPTDVPGESPGTFARYTGGWKDGVFSYETVYVRAAGKEPEGLIRREFTPTTEGLLVRIQLGSPPRSDSIALYKKPQDIEIPKPVKAAIGEMEWLAGAWTGTRGTGGTISMEERWSPSRGGSMLAVSRTVSRDRLAAFEYLRIVEKEGGLVYIAQPNGAAPTEFVLSEIGTNRAVFINPRHDYPKRIAYELSADGTLTATIGYLRGGTPRKFQFKREGT